MMRPAALLALTLSLTSPALAEGGPNLVPSSPAPMGAVGATALAWQLYAMGLDREDPVILLTAIRLAHGSDLRPATGWTVTSPDAVAQVPTAPSGLPRDPASEPAMALALLMAEGDPDLADLAADIEADLARHKPSARISTATSVLAGGSSESWRIPFNGLIPAELALIGESPAKAAGSLGLRITDETGATVCLQDSPGNLAYCAFTPARNGFFTVTVRNNGDTAQTYNLLSN